MYYLFANTWEEKGEICMCMCTMVWMFERAQEGCFEGLYLIFKFLFIYLLIKEKII